MVLTDPDLNLLPAWWWIEPTLTFRMWCLVRFLIVWPIAQVRTVPTCSGSTFDPQSPANQYISSYSRSVLNTFVTILKTALCHNWLVVGPPLCKIWVRQLGWLEIPNIHGKMPKMATSHHQPVIVDLPMNNGDFPLPLVYQRTHTTGIICPTRISQRPPHRLVSGSQLQRGQVARDADADVADAPRGPGLDPGNHPEV